MFVFELSVTSAFFTVHLLTLELPITIRSHFLVDTIFSGFSLFSEYLCHVYVRNDNLGAVVIADTEYPQRVCFTLLDKVCVQTCKIKKATFLHFAMSTNNEILLIMFF